MIASSVTWPWRRMARGQRTLLLLTYTLVALSGLIVGLGLRPLILHPARPGAGQSVTTAPATTTASASATVPLSPEAFTLTLTTTPRVARPGDTITARIQTVLKRDATQPAPNVLCSLTLTPLTAPLVIVSQTVDSTGLAEWRINLPATLAPGAYSLMARGVWGAFSWTYAVDLTVSR